MRSLFAWFSGIGRALFVFLLPLLKSQVGTLMGDPRVQKLAYEAVINWASYGKLSGDDKSIAASTYLIKEAKALGLEFGIGAATIVIEAAYQKLRAEAPKAVGK